MENCNKPTLQLSLEVLIRECRKEGTNKKDLFQAFQKTNRNNIHEVFKYQKFRDDFTDFIACYNDGEHIIGSFRPSYKEIYNKILLFLNVSIKNKASEEELINTAKERLKKLSLIKTETELLEEFPYIYNDLVEGRRYIKNIQNIKNTNEEEYKKLEHYYYSCGLKRNLQNFIKTQVAMYNRFLDRKELYVEKIENTSYDKFIRENFDLSKIAQYATYEYLKKCEKAKTKEELRKYFELVENYWNSNCNKDVNVKVKDGIILNKKLLKEKTDKIKEIVRNDSNIVNWIIIPEGRDYNKVEKTKESKIKKGKLSSEEKDRLIKKGLEKDKFYEKSDYIARAIGLEKYDGYVAYIYANGEVILDRMFSKDNPRTAEGDAIYHLKVEDFEHLSKLDKKKLQKINKVEKIIHSKNWKNRVNNIINKNVEEIEKEKTKEFIKRINKKY